MAAYPVRDLENFMRHWREKILSDPSAKKRVIVVNDQVVGNILSWESNGKRFVGYWIGKAHWGRGIATTALEEFVRNIEKTRPLFAYVATLNRRSARVIEKCGFVPVGGATARADGVEEALFQIQ